MPQGARAVDQLRLEGADSIDRNELLQRLATAPSPRLLGLFRGIIYDYAVLDEALLSSDLERIERYYRARGYYEAKVTAARVFVLDEKHVDVELRIYEGPTVVVQHVNVGGLQQLPVSVAAEALGVIELRPGTALDETAYERSKAEGLRVLQNAGYAFASVQAHADVDLGNHSAQVTLNFMPGPLTHYSKIELQGLYDLPEAPVRATFGLQVGERYSRAVLEDRRRAVAELGVFSNVQVNTSKDTASPGATRVSLLVQESPPRTLRLGGGVQLDTLEWSGHFTVGWEHRNFLGGLRRLNLELQPGAVFFPTNVNTFEAPSRVLLTGKFTSSLRQPAFIEARTTGVLSGELSAYPLLYPTLTPESAVVGFGEVSGQVGLERAFFEHLLRVSLQYRWESNFPIDYARWTLGREVSASAGDLLDGIVVSYPELGLAFDLRDDPVNPHQGVFVGNSLQAASTFVTGDVRDVRLQPDVRFYVPISRDVTFVTRTTIGLLWPFNYGDTLNAPSGSVEQRATLLDQQRLLFRGFFSGGPSSNRGYAFRGVGPQAPLGFLSRADIDCLAVLNQDDPRCEGPVGGLTLWEASLEVRFTVVDPLGAVLFADTSDLTSEVAQFRTDSPHLSAGAGVRYHTPIGPVRLDLGYRVPGLQSKRGEETPEPLFRGGPPMAAYFGLGEAF